MWTTPINELSNRYIVGIDYFIFNTIHFTLHFYNSIFYNYSIEQPVHKIYKYWIIRSHELGPIEAGSISPMVRWHLITIVLSKLKLNFQLPVSQVVSDKQSMTIDYKWHRKRGAVILELAFRIIINWENWQKYVE